MDTFKKVLWMFKPEFHKLWTKTIDLLTRLTCLGLLALVVEWHALSGIVLNCLLIFFSETKKAELFHDQSIYGDAFKGFKDAVWSFCGLPVKGYLLQNSNLRARFQTAALKKIWTLNTASTCICKKGNQHSHFMINSFLDILSKVKNAQRCCWIIIWFSDLKSPKIQFESKSATELRKESRTIKHCHSIVW